MAETDLIRGNILLSLVGKIACIRNKYDLLDMFQNSLREFIDFEDSFVLVYDKAEGKYKTFIHQLKNDPDAGRLLDKLNILNFPVIPGNDSKIPVKDGQEVRWQLSEEHIFLPLFREAGYNDFVILRLTDKDGMIGLAGLLSERENVFAGKPMEFLQGISSPLSIAAANSILYDEIFRQEKEKSLLISINAEIAAVVSGQDLYQTLNNCIGKIISICGLVILKFENGDGLFSDLLSGRKDQVKAYPVDAKDGQAMFAVSDPVFSRVVNEDTPVLFEVDELVNQKDIPDYVLHWEKTGVKRVLGTALRAGDTLVGAAVFILENGSGISTNGILLKGVFSQLAVSVSNILANEKILAKEAEKTRLLEFSNAMASAGDQQTLAKVLKNQLNELFGINDYVIHILDNDKSAYRPVLFDHEADFARHPAFLDLIHSENSISNSVFRAILATGDLVVFNTDDWLDSSGPNIYTEAAKDLSIKRMAGVSIKLGQETVGVMNFRKDGLNRVVFQEPLFKSICSQLAITISNITANLEIRRREEEKSMLLEFSNVIASVRDKYIFAKVLKQQLTKLFSIEDYVINILSEDQQYVCRFLYDIENEMFSKPEFLKILDTPIDVNDGVFNVILSTDGPVTFKVAEWAAWKKPPVYMDAAIATGLKNLTGVRLQLGERNIAFLSFKHDDFGLPASRIHFLKSICSQIAIAVSNIIANEKVAEQLAEIERYREQLEEEKIYLKEEIETSHHYSEIIGESNEIRKVFKMVSQVASSDSTVLLLGETGTGKELIARAIHNSSPRKDKLMIKINCAALPVNLIESELFGHERGSFTGAYDRRIGKFELANNGTLFLDEIGEMPLELQVKLLRALQEKEIERIGGKTTIKTNVRIIAATNRNLEKLIEEGKFRIDLFYRLNIFPVQLPPLKKRKEDIPELAYHFILRFSKKAGKKISKLSGRALEQLKHYDWPGNIRELEHLIERSVLLSSGDTIKEVDLPANKSGSPAAVITEDLKIQTIFENEKEYILKILKLTDGRIAGAGGAASILGIPASTLNSRIKKLGIRKEHRG